MKKAVIVCGATQYLVTEGDELSVNYIESGDKDIEFTPLMVVDGAKSIMDVAKLKGMKIKARVIEQESKGDKVISIRYKAKKRVNTRRGHRQKLTKIQIVSL